LDEDRQRRLLRAAEAAPVRARALVIPRTASASRAVRFLGFVPDDLASVPETALAFLAGQVDATEQRRRTARQRDELGALGRPLSRILLECAASCRSRASSARSGWIVCAIRVAT